MKLEQLIRQRREYRRTVTRSKPKNLNKDQIVTIIAVILLLFTALINWNIYSWLILVAVILLLLAWYFKK